MVVQGIICLISRFSPVWLAKARDQACSEDRSEGEAVESVLVLCGGCGCSVEQLASSVGRLGFRHLECLTSEVDG